MSEGKNIIIGASVPVYTRQGLDGLEVWFAFMDLFGKLRQATMKFPGSTELPDSLSASAFTEPPKDSVSTARDNMRSLGYMPAHTYNVYLSPSQQAFFLIRSDQDNNPEVGEPVIESIAIPDHLDFRA